MDRTPEPELMDDVAQAAAYAAADFAAPHQWFADECVARFPALGVGGTRVLDLGCGAADITVRLAHLLPGAVFVAIDGAAAMLDEARRRIEREHLSDRIELRHLHLPDDDWLARAPFDAVVSNSLLHHLAEPEVLWNTISTTAAPHAPVFVMDLLRPPTSRAVDDLVERYAEGEPDVLVADFRNSLHAAYRPDEVRAQLIRADLPSLEVEVVSDRHLLVSGTTDGRG